MIMNLLFGILPDLIGGIFLYAALYWIGVKIIGKLSTNEDDIKKEKSSLKFWMSFAYGIFVIVNVWSTWHTYGLRVEAHPFGQQQMQYEPQKTQIETGKQLVESEDKSGSFHEKALEKPQ